MPANETNLKMLKKIEKLEHLGQRPEEIIVALKIPDAVLVQLQLGLLAPAVSIETQRKK